MRATKAIIRLDNLKYNIQRIKKFISPETKICIPVKADAYGHGAIQVSIAAIKAGAAALAVASVQEGIQLRDAGIVAPIISLSLPTPEEVDEILGADIHPLVMDRDFITAMDKRAEALNTIGKVHLKVDTGMSRIGCTPQEAGILAQHIRQCKHLELKGVATHFAVSDSTNPSDIEITKKQIAQFETALQNIRSLGISPGIVHAANSGAVIQYKQAHYDMVRPGILVYGFIPSADLHDSISLKPVMSLVTQVVLIKKITKGTTVSYGCHWKTEKDTYIGTLPIGYADGLHRLLSGHLQVKIADRFYPVVGTICMDQCMVDLGDKPVVKRWDTAEIFGCSETGNTAETIAAACGTISYEVISNINKRVPRIYLE